MDEQNKQLAGERNQSLPEEVIFGDILVRLPSRSLANFIFIRKSWSQFIRSPSFIRTHLSNCFSSYKDNPSTGYLFHMFLDGEKRETAYHLLSDGPNGYAKVLDLKPPIDFVSGSCSVVDSCAGLLCLTENDDVLYGRVVYLWNPSVRRIITIRNSSREGISKELSWIALGFGYDFDAGVFKLVRIIYDSPNCEAPYDLEKTEIEVYNLSTGSWRKNENLVVNWIIYCQLRIVYVNGFVNWLAFHPE